MKTLQDWLSYISHLHNKRVDLGLEKVRLMIKKLNISFPCPVFIVGGTNGKGSVCGFLEAALRSAGYKTALHTSPHLLNFNERARLNGKFVSDEILIKYFELVEAHRDGLALSYFEFTLLAILKWFQDEKPDAVILEIGLGGRLDAVNTMEPTVATITSIGIDHTSYLGNTREEIAWDKAHIYRPGKPAICGDIRPPQTLIDYAKEINANLLIAGQDFKFTCKDGCWNYAGPAWNLEALPLPAMRGHYQIYNAAAAIATLEAQRERLPITRQNIEHALKSVQLTGRFQTVSKNPELVVDVGHNPHAARELAKSLNFYPVKGKTRAVFGMLKDKDRASVCRIMKDSVDQWYVADLGSIRGGKAEDLAAFLIAAGVPAEKIKSFNSVNNALQNARKDSSEIDRIIAFGSFLTVTEILTVLDLKVV